MYEVRSELDFICTIYLRAPQINLRSFFMAAFLVFVF